MSWRWRWTAAEETSESGEETTPTGGVGEVLLRGKAAVAVSGEHCVGDGGWGSFVRPFVATFFLLMSYRPR